MKFKPVWIIHAIVFIAISTLFVMQHLELAKTYNKGIALAEEGNYEEAYKCMSSIAEYKDAPDKTELYQMEITYQSGCAALEKQDWDEALLLFDAILNIDEYKDTEDKKYLCLYEKARALAFSGDIRSAELMFMRLPLDFLDVTERKQVIADHKKFGGSWRCDENNLDLKTTVYIDYDNIPRIKAVISDNDGLLLDEPVTLNGEGMEIFTDRFSWAIYGTDSYSFVYGKDTYTVMKQPVVAGTQKYSFDRILSADYDAITNSYMSVEF